MAVSNDYKECGVRLIFLSAFEYLQKKNRQSQIFWLSAQVTVEEPESFMTALKESFLFTHIADIAEN